MNIFKVFETEEEKQVKAVWRVSCVLAVIGLLFWWYVFKDKSLNLYAYVSSFGWMIGTGGIMWVGLKASGRCRYLYYTSQTQKDKAYLWTTILNDVVTVLAYVAFGLMLPLVIVSCASRVPLIVPRILVIIFVIALVVLLAVLILGGATAIFYSLRRQYKEVVKK